MINSEYLNDFEEALNKMYEICQKKNADYADISDPFRNFRMVEQMWLCTVEQWLLVRMSDKMSRISNLLEKEAQVNDESIEDTLIDLANYSIILKLYIQWKTKSKK